LRIGSDNPNFIKKLDIYISGFLIRSVICRSTICFRISRDSSDNSVSINHISPHTHGNISIPVFQHGSMPRAAVQQHNTEKSTNVVWWPLCYLKNYVTEPMVQLNFVLAIRWVLMLTVVSVTSIGFSGFPVWEIKFSQIGFTIFKLIILLLLLLLPWRIRLSCLLIFRINYEIMNLTDSWYDSLDGDQPVARPLSTYIGSIKTEKDADKYPCIEWESNVQPSFNNKNS
jgi:hypothetical protein